MVQVPHDQVIVVKLPDNRYAKLKITARSGVYPDRTVTFVWAYQPILNYPRFAPPQK